MNDVQMNSVQRISWTGNLTRLWNCDGRLSMQRRTFSEPRTDPARALRTDNRRKPFEALRCKPFSSHRGLLPGDTDSRAPGNTTRVAPNPLSNIKSCRPVFEADISTGLGPLFYPVVRDRRSARHFHYFSRLFLPASHRGHRCNRKHPSDVLPGGANLQLSRWQSFSNIILPAIVPNVILALRVTLGIAWVVVVAAEMIGMKSGLGFLIIDGRDALRLDRVAAAMVVIGFIGLVLDRIMEKLAQMELVRWKIEQK